MFDLKDQNSLQNVRTCRVDIKSSYCIVVALNSKILWQQTDKTAFHQVDIVDLIFNKTKHQ